MANMTMTWADLKTGDRVQVTGDFSDYGLNTGGQVTFSPGRLYEVRRVATEKVVLRHEERHASAWVPMTLLASADPNAPKPRALGETPEGDHIAVDDPRVAWMWEDAAKIADKNGYCATYDKLADELGAPGREREYKVWTVINGLRARVQVKARSKKLAEALVTETIPNGADVSASEL